MREDLNISEAIAFLDEQIPDASAGLPEEVFLYVSRMTPMVNVDLLVQDEDGRTLLAWRDDPYAGRGWHIPGGIVRLKETLETRVRKVSELEIGTMVEFDPRPIALNQIILRDSVERSHFVSLLYKCFLSSKFVPENKLLSPSNPGFLAWHKGCPDNLIEMHGIYRQHIANGIAHA